MLLKTTNVIPRCGPNVGFGITVMPSLGHDRAANRPESMTTGANQTCIPQGSTRVRQPIQNNRKSPKSHHRSLRHQQERWGSGGRNLLLKATNVIPRCGTLRRRIKKSFRRKAGRFFNHSPQFPAAAACIPRAYPAPGRTGRRGVQGGGR